MQDLDLDSKPWHSMHSLLTSLEICRAQRCPVLAAPGFEDTPAERCAVQRTSSQYGTRAEWERSPALPTAQLQQRTIMLRAPYAFRKTS